MATEKTPRLHKDIPASVSIGGTTYSVEPWFVALTEDDERWGETSFEEQTIRINQNLPAAMQVAVLWHEIFHIFLDRSGLCDIVAEKVEEALCRSFGYFMQELETSGLYKLQTGGG